MKPDEKETHSIKTLATSSDRAREIWSFLKTDGLEAGKATLYIWGMKLNQIDGQAKIAPWAYEEDAALNRCYARMEMMTELSCRLLAYPTEFMRTRDARHNPEGAAKDPHEPAGVEFLPFWRFRNENMRGMEIGKAHQYMLNEVRTAVGNILAAVKENKAALAAVTDYSKTDVELDMSRAHFFAAKRALLTREFPKLRDALKDAYDQIVGSEEIMAERADSTAYAMENQDPAIVKFRLILSFVKEELLPRIDHELDVMRGLQKDIEEKRIATTPSGLISERHDALIFDLPSAARAEVSQPQGEDLDEAIAQARKDNVLITDEELRLARELRQKNGRGAA